MKILFADDEIGLLDLYVEEVNEAFSDVVVFTARDGIEAYEICKENQIDLIFTDGRMPRMDGVELAERLKKENYPAHIFMITGHYRDVDQKMLQNSSIKKVFTKPIDYDELLDFIYDQKEFIMAE